ncbi:cell division protein FtsQ/DivIB [Austwickia chelonae]|uniref:cell division protein FtsQ/DivIB n=1 Tax=Austwickia chelonae TaxID=100225 RepID=UPI0002EC30A7|nr:FtsQ-type POTRA domain-containing protein [Austwickia chelonae]
MALAVLWVVLGSPWLRVASVEVVGGDPDIQEQVHGIMDPHKGESLIQVDTVGLQRDVARLPKLARADVMRDWPNRLKVTVVPRKPVMAVDRGQSLDLIDGDGAAYMSVSLTPQGVPTVAVAHDDDKREIVAAASAMKSLDAGQRAKVSGLEVSSPDNVRFVVDGVAVIWGGSGQGRQKALILTALLQQKGVRSINVSAPDSPVAS